jgi:hypothetical protein
VTGLGFLDRWDGLTETFPGDRRRRNRRKPGASTKPKSLQPPTGDEPDSGDVVVELLEAQTEAAARLFRLVESQAADPDVSRWLASGFRRWLSSGGDVPLTSCLGLPGKARLVLRQVRDIWLREAGALFEGGPWQRAQWLRAEIRRFAAGPWQRWRAQALPPENAGRLDVLLHFAFRVEAPMPKTTQAVWAILKQCEKPE